MDLITFFDVIQKSGQIGLTPAMIFGCIIAWRFDRRMVIIEAAIKTFANQQERQDVMRLFRENRRNQQAQHNTNPIKGGR